MKEAGPTQCIQLKIKPFDRLQMAFKVGAPLSLKTKHGTFFHVQIITWDWCKFVRWSGRDSERNNQPAKHQTENCVLQKVALAIGGVWIFSIFDMHQSGKTNRCIRCVNKLQKCHISLWLDIVKKLFNERILNVHGRVHTNGHGSYQFCQKNVVSAVVVVVGVRIRCTANPL